MRLQTVYNATHRRIRCRVRYLAPIGSFSGRHVEHLIGTAFAVASEQYVIRDVRKVRGDVLLYAEKAHAGSNNRAAFHLNDVAHLLPGSEPASKSAR